MAKDTNPVTFGLTHADLVSNITAVLDLAPAEQLQDGVTWYRRARRTAGVLGRLAGYKGKRAYSVGAGILAALSPSLKWEVNVPCAFAVVANGGVRLESDESRRQSRANVAKAVRILKGEHPLDVLGGNKVRNFYVCILNPQDVSAVCVDRHAAAVAYGYTLTEAQMRDAVKVTKSVDRYGAIAEAYRAVAAVRGLLPLEVQAVTWVVWRTLTDGRTGAYVFDAAGVTV